MRAGRRFVSFRYAHGYTHTIALFHALLSAVLLFLIILTLRNHFRIR